MLFSAVLLAAALASPAPAAAGTPAAAPTAVPIAITMSGGHSVVRREEAARYLDAQYLPVLRSQLAHAPQPEALTVGPAVCDIDIVADGARHQSCRTTLQNTPLRIRFVVLAVRAGVYDVQYSLEQDVLFASVIQKQLEDDIVTSFPGAAVKCSFSGPFMVMNVGETTSCSVVNDAGTPVAVIFLEANDASGHVTLKLAPL